MKKIIFTLSLVFSIVILNAQLGLLSLKKEKVVDGYTMIYPNGQNIVYLLNNCGEVVHKWVDAPTSRPGNSVFLLENGSLLKTKRPANISADTIWAGGGGATIELVDWDNKPSWSYTLNNGKGRLHHDIKQLPNGNIIAIAWERWTKQKAIAEGRDTTKITQSQLWPDYIIEIDPKINSANPIVWEWHAKDHLIQDYDATKNNFGVVADHPELIDLNYDTSMGIADWMHSNAIDYNVQLDQIILSVPTFSELWVIDHSTTTQEAASHAGGRAKQGGDLLYRIGNPLAYRRGSAADQTLFYPHDCHWIQDLPLSHPDYGKILVFNNQISTSYSTVEKFDAPWSMYDVAYTKTSGVWGPKKFTNTITHPGPKSFVSSGLSSAQIMPNDNILLLSGRQGYITEMTKTKEIVWEYVIPIKAGKPVATTEVLADNDNVTFRAYKYAPDYAGLAGKNLSAIGFIQSDGDATLCDRVTSAIDLNPRNFTVYPNPVNDKLHLNVNSNASYKITDITGKIIMTGNTNDYIDVASLKSGFYIVELAGLGVERFVKE